MKNIEKKIRLLKDLFANCSNQEDVYHKIIELGKSLKDMSPENKIAVNKIQGCQSSAFITTTYQGDHIHFEGCSDALISAGLMFILLSVYNDEEAEAIIKADPTFLKELNIQNSLTPGRANGMASMLLRMKQEALKILMTQQNI